MSSRVASTKLVLEILTFPGCGSCSDATNICLTNIIDMSKLLGMSHKVGTYHWEKTRLAVPLLRVFFGRESRV